MRECDHTLAISLSNSAPWTAVLCPPSRMGSFIHTEYADTFIAVSHHVEVGVNDATEAGEALNASGLPTHPVESGFGGTTLGWEFWEPSTVIGLNHVLRWKLHLGLMEMSIHRYATGDTVCRLVSHFTSRALIRRELLSVMGAVYVFSERYGSKPAELWPAAQRELMWCDYLAVL